MMYVLWTTELVIPSRPFSTGADLWMIRGKDGQPGTTDMKTYFLQIVNHQFRIATAHSPNAPHPLQDLFSP